MQENSKASATQLAEELRELDAKIASVNRIDPLQPLLDQIANLRGELASVEGLIARRQYSNFGPSIKGVEAELQFVDSVAAQAPQRSHDLRFGTARLDLAVNESLIALADNDEECDALKDLESVCAAKREAFGVRVAKLKDDCRGLTSRREKLLKGIELLERNIVAMKKSVEINVAYQEKQDAD